MIEFVAHDENDSALVVAVGGIKAGHQGRAVSARWKALPWPAPANRRQGPRFAAAGTSAAFGLLSALNVL